MLQPKLKFLGDQISIHVMYYIFIQFIEISHILNNARNLFGYLTYFKNLKGTANYWPNISTTTISDCTEKSNMEYTEDYLINFHFMENKECDYTEREIRKLSRLVEKR